MDTIAKQIHQKTSSRHKMVECFLSRQGKSPPVPRKDDRKIAENIFYMVNNWFGKFQQVIMTLKNSFVRRTQHLSFSPATQWVKKRYTSNKSKEKYCSLYRSKIAVVTLINLRGVQIIRGNYFVQKIHEKQ